MVEVIPVAPVGVSLLLASCLSLLFRCVAASNGDRSFVFGKCVQRCRDQWCQDELRFSSTQPLQLWLLAWSCADECKYQCMWDTVLAYQKDGSRIPQFYGKWPFIRLAGIQEPASTLFSLLNAASHLAIFYYRSKVPPETPMYHVWHGMAIMGVVTWLCAAIFHTRDTPLTEKLDYYSAFGLILYNLFTLVCRAAGSHHRTLTQACALVLICGYLYHVHYLTFVRFDYGYNMIVNVVAGVVNGLGWLAWSAFHWKSGRYVVKCVVVILGLNVLLLLELGDFPPIFWTFDAHALWHAGTIPLSLLWYSFITDDALGTAKEIKSSMKKTV